MTSLDRRRFLAMLASATAAGAVGCRPSQPRTPDPVAIDGSPTSAATAAPTTEAVARGPVNEHRTLVVVEMSGGSDGLGMLQPADNGVLLGQRPDLVVPDEELVMIGDGYGLHPTLAGVAELGVAAAVGVGSHAPDFSHFEMEQRWWRGDSEPQSELATGFFGRLCDQLDVGAPVTGLSIAGGPTPALLSEKSVTVGLTHPDAGSFFTRDEPWFRAFRHSIDAMSRASADDSPAFAAARLGLERTSDFADSLAEIPDGENDVYPWTDLGQQLRFAAEVMALDVGVRVIHTRYGGFDTHRDQAWQQPRLLEEFNEAAVAFAGDLRQRGLWGDTLVVTTSEFGRRVPQNDGGTDHGGASTMLVCGAGTGGVHGIAPDLSRLDDGNLVATARFEDYYATIASDWFEVDPDLVLPAGATPITGLI